MFVDPMYLGSSDPHSEFGTHSAAAPSSWAPSGSLQQLEAELDLVLLNVPLPHCNVVPNTDFEDPLTRPDVVPGPFTTAELIPEGVYKR